MMYNKPKNYVVFALVLLSSVLHGASNGAKLNRQKSFANRMKLGEYGGLHEKQKRNPIGDYSKLDFSHEELTDLEGLNNLPGVPKDKVISLYLNNNDIKELTDPTVFSGFTNLQELHLENNPIYRIDPEVFAPINRSNVTVTLSMSGQDIHGNVLQQIRSALRRPLKHNENSKNITFNYGDKDTPISYGDLAKFGS